jgi:DNA-binding CsgD family transcriptional regulator
VRARPIDRKAVADHLSAAFFTRDNPGPWQDGKPAPGTFARAIWDRVHRRSEPKGAERHLTPYQWKILRLYRRGMRTKQIAMKLGKRAPTIWNILRDLRELGILDLT